MGCLSPVARWEHLTKNPENNYDVTGLVGTRLLSDGHVSSNLPGISDLTWRFSNFAQLVATGERASEGKWLDGPETPRPHGGPELDDSRQACTYREDARWF